MVERRDSDFAAGMVELMARGINQQGAFPVLTFQEQFRATLLEDYVDQNDTENEGRRSADDLDFSISGEPPINHASMSIQTKQRHRNGNNQNESAENAQ